MSKKFVITALCLSLLFVTFFGCSDVEYTSPVGSGSSKDKGVYIVSFNVAAPWGNLLDGTSSSSRAQRFASYMNSIKPDSIGTQEMNSEWMSKLQSSMPDYSSYGVIRGGDENEKKSEMNTIFWRKDTYDCVDKGTFWLSETPEVESKYSGAGCYRICSYVVLVNKTTGASYIHFNTHLDNASQTAANFGAKVIMTKMAEIRKQYPSSGVILTGDLNQSPGMSAYNTIAATLYDSQKVAKYTELEGTYTDWGNVENTQPIDYIFSSEKNVTVYTVLDDLSNGYVSDHYGLFAEIMM